LDDGPRQATAGSGVRFGYPNFFPLSRPGPLSIFVFFGAASDALSLVASGTVVPVFLFSDIRHVLVQAGAFVLSEFFSSNRPFYDFLLPGGLVDTANALCLSVSGSFLGEIP